MRLAWRGTRGWRGGRVQLWLKVLAAWARLSWKKNGGRASSALTLIHNKKPWSSSLMVGHRPIISPTGKAAPRRWYSLAGAPCFKPPKPPTAPLHRSVACILDAMYGSFRPTSAAWLHSNMAVVPGAPGESSQSYSPFSAALPLETVAVVAPG